MAFSVPVFGIPGVLLAILIQLTVREPLKVRVPEEQAQAGLFSALGNIFRLPSFAHIMVGVGFTGIAGYGLGVWSPSFLVRVHDMSLVDAGLYLGLIGVSEAVSVRFRVDCLSTGLRVTISVGSCGCLP